MGLGLRRSPRPLAEADNEGDDPDATKRDAAAGADEKELCGVRLSVKVERRQVMTGHGSEGKPALRQSR
jgi:hypothetical protein